MAFANFRHPNLVDYSSEHVPLLLISLALYGTVRVLRNPEAYGVPVFLLGLAACAAFFAKMQSVPIVVAMSAVAVAYVHASGWAKWWKPTLLFLAGAAPLAVLNAAFCLLTGVWPDFVMAYIIANQRYADVQASVIIDLPWFVAYLVDTIEIRYLLFTFFALAAAYSYQRARGGILNDAAAFLRMAGIGATAFAAAIFIRGWNSGADYAYVLWIAILAIPTYFVLSYRKRLFGNDSLSWFGITALAALGAALFSIYKPHHPFPHYLLLLIVPVCAGMAWMVMRQAGRGFSFVSLFVVLTVAYGSYLWGSQDNQALTRIPYALRPLEGNLIRAMTSPGSQIVVWGWTVGPYLGSGRIPATRDTNMANFFSTLWPEISTYYRQRFVRDLMDNPAELFIDAVGPKSWAFTDSRFNFEQCPEIKAYIDLHYVHLVDLYEQRYYLRRDLVGKRRLPFIRDPALCEPGALRCLDKASTEPRQLKPIQMPGHALLEIRFTPSAPESANATLFSNERMPGSFRGFQFFHVGGDEYRFAFGLGSNWAFSKEISFEQGEAASLWVEFNGDDITIRRNGEFEEQMHLPRPVADSDGPITLESWIGGERRFEGEIKFFQISDLQKPL